MHHENTALLLILDRRSTTDLLQLGGVNRRPRMRSRTSECSDGLRPVRTKKAHSLEAAVVRHGRTSTRPIAMLPNISQAAGSVALASGRKVGSRNTDPTHGGGHIILVELRPPKKLLLGWPEPGLPLAGSALLQYDPTFGAASFSCLPAQNAARSGWFSRSAESRQPHGANPAASVARSVDLNAQHRVDIPRHRVDFAHRQPRNPPDRH